MANEQNLVPGAHPLTVEEASKGGINSGKARRAKRDRQERIKALFALAITDPKLRENLKRMGIDATDMDIETAMDARQALKAMREGDTNSYRTLKEEAYGPLPKKQELEVSGEIDGININIKRFDTDK